MLGFGKANGGIEPMVAMANGGTLQFNSYAQGGVATSPTLGLFGENPFFQGEAFVPLPDGKRIPVEGGGAGPVVNFQVSAMDSKSFDERILERRQTLVGVIREATIRDRNFRSTVGRAR